MNGPSHCLFKLFQRNVNYSFFCQEMYSFMHYNFRLSQFPGKLASYPVSNDMNDTSNFRLFLILI